MRPFTIATAEARKGKGTQTSKGLAAEPPKPSRRRIVVKRAVGFGARSSDRLWVKRTFKYCRTRRSGPGCRLDANSCVADSRSSWQAQDAYCHDRFVGHPPGSSRLLAKMVDRSCLQSKQAGDAHRIAATLCRQSIEKLRRGVADAECDRFVVISARGGTCPSRLPGDVWASGTPNGRFVTCSACFTA